MDQTGGGRAQTKPVLPSSKPLGSRCSAGLRDGDVIIAINGKTVTETRDVMDAVQNSHTLAIVVRRGNEDAILTVKPDEID